jgi:1,4-dihydroxy-2-naphthoyl-CoA hydrolase
MAMDPESLLALMPFASLIGVELVRADATEVEGRLPWAPERCTTGGILHGGILMAFADTVGAVCAFLNVPQGAGTTTVESKTNFMRGVTEGVVTALSAPLHAGRRFVVVQTNLRNDAGKLVAQVTQTQAVL